MDPAKLEGVSRQSSILKPTKPRQPLQCVAPNPDPLESSPTIKLKRRVSFAKNKRIREFCNEAEPKAVWDDTYEEHDSSGTKSNSTGGNEPLTITVSCQDKENFPVQLFLRTDQVECTEISSNTLARDDNLSQCDMEMDNTLNNPGLQNEDKENATIYCDDGMDTTYLPSRIIACHNQCTDYLNDKECMDITDNLPMVPCKNSTAHQSNKTHMLKNHGGNSTELTIAISQLLGAGHVNKQSSDPTKSQSLSDNIENTAPMEFTSVIPSSTWIKPNSICHSEKKILIDKRATDLSNATLQNNMHDEINTDGTSILLEKTKIFGDESMEITEAMPLQQIVQTNVRLCNTVPETIKTTETAAYKHIECTRKISDELLLDKTKIFNESVEATEAIPVYIENCEKVPRKNGLHPGDGDVTKYFKDKSVEVTEAIPVYIENRDEMHDMILQEIQKNKSNNFYKSKEVIPIYIEDCDQMPSKVLPKVNEDKTKIFTNKSIEMTEPIMNCNENENRKQNTNVLPNESMKNSEAISALNTDCIQSRPLVERTPNNTLHVEKSMNTTGTIPIFYKFHHSNHGKFANKLDENQTNIYGNEPMEMTEAVAFYNPIKDQANITGKLVQTHLLEKTNALADASMEMTESVPVPKIYQSKPRVTRIEVLEKTKVFADTSMDMTMTVPVSSAHQYPERVPINKTKVQLSAEQVPVYNTNYECSSQKIDEPLASIISKDSPSPKDLYQEKTQCFNDKSMNITETIPVPQNILLNLQHRQMLADDGAEKTKIFADDSVNITETAPIEQNVSVIKHSKVPLVSDKTRFFNNKSMEITEALPVLLDVRESDKSINPTEEKTKIFSNKSMDLTETFAVLNSYRSTEDGGPHFASRNQMSPIYKVSTIPKSDSNVHYFTSGKNISSNQSFYNDMKSPNNDSMEMTGELSASQAKKTYNFESEKIANQETRETGNFLKNVPGNLSSSCSRPNNVQNELDISRKSRAGVTDVSAKFMIYEEPDGQAKIFDNASMNLSALPPTATSATNLSRKTNVSHNQSILSTRMDATQNPMNVSSYFNSSIGNDHLDRITSDELNSLCASMNLPIQKYSRENTAMKNSSIPCNDFNALRDSLRNGTLFQQLNILPMQSTSAEIASARNYEIIDSKENSKTDFEMESCRDASKNMSMSTNVLGAHGAFVNKSTTGQNNFYVFETDMLSKSITTPLIPMETTSEMNFKRVPLAEMDVDGTTHLGLKNMTLPRLSSIPMDTDKTAEISLKNVPSAEPSGSHQAFPAPSTLPDRIVSIPEVDKSHSRMDVSMIQEYPPKTAAIVVHNSIKVTDQSAQSSCTVKETLASGDAQSIQAHCKYKVNANPGRIEIYHDVSMEIGGASTSKAYAKRKSDEICEPAAKRNPASQAVCTYMPASESSSKSKNPDDNSLSKMPSDSTEVLLATMGFKTELAYPLIINEKTTIKVSQKPPIDKTFVVTGDASEENQGETAEHSSAEPNRTFAAVESDGIQTEVTRTDATGTENVESQAEQEVVDEAQAIENGVPHVGIPIVKSPGGRGPVNIEEDDENELDEDKENKEPSVKINLFVEKYSELENIEPPSFLASESFQEEDDLSDITKLPDDDGDEGDVGDRPNSSMRILEDDNVIVPFAELENSRKLIASNLSPKPVPQKFEQKLDSNHFSENIMRIRKRRQELLEELKRLSKSDADVKTSKKKANFLEALSVTQDKVDGVQVINENVIKETLSPFEQLTEDLKSFEKRDDCIWSVRKIDTKLIAVDFISKSLVIVIKLTEAKRSDSTKDIEKIEVISRVSVESKNVLMKIVHNILLSKLNPSDMLDKYKVFEDVLLLLEFVSSEVIFAMKFMFDLEKLNALNLLDIDERRVIFMASSRKANIILKLSVALKSFSDIGPDDIDVICILGDVRINDVKQLVVNIRRDYKFLSRYIKDVKDYITLMEESTSFHKL